MRRSFVRLAASVFVLSASAVGHAQEGSDGLRRFEAQDVFGLEWASGPRLSPSGTEALYLRRGFDIMADKGIASLWLVDLETGAQEPLLTGAPSISSPRWSPDGGRIAFVGKTADGRHSVEVLYLKSGRLGSLAAMGERPGDLAWSPDGTHLAFTMKVPGEGAPLVEKRKAPEGAEWAELPKLIDRPRYRADGDGFLELAHSHLFVLPATGGTPRQLTSGDFEHEGPLAFTPDGREILFSANRHEGWALETIEADIFAVTMDGDLRQITDLPGAEESPAISPDGTRLAFLRTENRPDPFIVTDLRVMDIRGGEAKSLTPDLDRNARDPQWLADGARIAFAFDDRGRRQVALAGLDGTIDVVVEDVSGTTIGRPYISGDFDAGRDGRILFTRGTPQRPADLWIALPGRAPKRLTALNEDLLAHRDLARLERFSVQSRFDGETIEGWYLLPPGHEEGDVHPAILEIHGGPHLAYGPHFSAEMQLMAAAGYVVVYDNYRGSSSYGERFANLLKYKYSSEEDFADHMSAVDYVVEKGIADEDNLFIAGGSAGGIAAAYAVGLTDRFNAAVAAKPVINWLSKTLTADSYIYQIRHQFPDVPWNAVDHYWQRSPLSLAGKVTTPTLLITGEEDYRTPISETEQFFQALQLQEVPSAMVRIPGTSHGIAGRPSLLIAKTDYTLAWFERYRTAAED